MSPNVALIIRLVVAVLFVAFLWANGLGSALTTIGTAIRDRVVGADAIGAVLGGRP
jgi:hypothetical protein